MLNISTEETGGLCSLLWSLARFNNLFNLHVVDGNNNKHVVRNMSGILTRLSILLHESLNLLVER